MSSSAQSCHLRSWIDRIYRIKAVYKPANKRCVAIDISAHLKYWCFSVTARQRHKIWLGHNYGYLNRTVALLFVAQ